MMRKKKNMDAAFAAEEMPRPRKPRRKGRWWKILLVVLVVLLAAAAAAGLVIWNQNEFTLDLQLQGQEEIVLEYAQRFEDPGAEAAFSGTLLMKEAQAVPVTVEGRVDSKTLGTYTLTYNAGYVLDYYFGQLEFDRQCRRTVHVVDTTPPVVGLVVKPGGYTIPGESYVEEGFIAYDNHDGDITDRVLRQVTGSQVCYTVADSSGNLTKTYRDIVYHDPIPPTLTLKGDLEMRVWRGAKYNEPGYEAMDNCDGDITDWVKIDGEVDTENPGTYTLIYSVTDSYNNTVTATRTVVVPDTPKIPELPEGSYTEPVSPNGKVIYLTFDDGPSQHTSRLLDVLDKYNVKATFFVLGNKNLSILSRMVSAGHTVAMHSNTHNYSLIYSNEAAFFEDLKLIQNKIAAYTGYPPTILRFPGGSSNTVSRRYNDGIMTRLTQMVDEMGYRYFDWNVGSGDTDGLKTAEEVYAQVIYGVKKHRVSIVLQHDTKGYSVDAVEWIIQWAFENGYTFKALDNSSPVCEHYVNN